MKRQLSTALCALILTTLGATIALPAAAQGFIEEVVVTGTADGGELRKFDASFAITNVSDSDIAKFSPKSTADLLKTVPGVWAESSGGVAGANIFVRGFPSTGDAPFYTLQLEGAPIFPPATLSFLENTSIFRIDETIARVEGLRGGPQAVQDNGQPGLTTNFLLKEGSADTEGLVKYSTSDYDLQRFDAMLSGELSEGLYYMIGGYVSASPGIRDTGYTSEEGDQFTIHLTKDLDNGTLGVYHRVTDDHGTWYLPQALNGITGNASGERVITSLDMDSSYVQNGTRNRQQVVRVGPDGEEHSIDLADGRGWDGSVSGLTFDLDISDTWQLSNSLNLTAGNADTVGLVTEGRAVNAGYVVGGGASLVNRDDPRDNSFVYQRTRTAATDDATTDDVDESEWGDWTRRPVMQTGLATGRNDDGSFQYALEGGTHIFSYEAGDGRNPLRTVNGDEISSDSYIQQFGTWEVRKEIESITNNLALSGAFDQMDLVFGYYTASVSVEEDWTLGNFHYYELRNGGQRVAGVACNEASRDGCVWNYDIDASGDSRANAFYTTAAYRISDNLSFDIGLRNESHEVQYSIDEGLNGEKGKFVDYDESKTSYTLGANFDLSENMGVFFRYSLGYKFPTFDDFRDNYGTYSGTQGSAAGTAPANATTDEETWAMTVSDDTNTETWTRTNNADGTRLTDADGAPMGDGTPDCQQNPTLDCTTAPTAVAAVAALPGADLIQEVEQIEIGYKASFSNLSAYLTLFYNEAEGNRFTPRPGAPSEISANEAIGIEMDVRWQNEAGLSLVFNGTIQETEISKSAGNDGNEAQRQPPYQFRISPSYDFDMGLMTATLYGSLTMVDDRFSDNANTVILPGYEKLDLGVIVNPSDELALQVVLDNFTDEEGLTEGDPRNAGVGNGRYILPRSVKFSLAYSF